jgi:tetratricopeptide (TPR) repeat protein
MSANEVPAPSGARTAEEFVDRLAALRLWAGLPSLRTLCGLGGTVPGPGGVLLVALPPTTVSWVLKGKGLPRLPKLTFVEAFVTACLTAAGRPLDEIPLELTRWRAVWRDIAAGVKAAGGARAITAYHQLPADIAEFTGRQDELARISAWAEDSPTAPAIVTIAGMAGVGKTRLAVHASHRFAASGAFPDAQLWAELRGFHPEHAAVEPGTVLATFLRLLGVPPHQVPDDVDACAALYRDRLRGRRALILLDDAASVEQVRPLLPGEPGCLVLITSRHSLTALDGTRPLRLEPLAADEAIDLLAWHAGQAQVDAEPEAARLLTKLCGHLPLAVAMTGRYLRNRPGWGAGDLAARLGTGAGGLADAPAARSVRTLFDLSRRALPTGYQRVFGLLTAHPGDSFAAASVAALARIGEQEAQVVLDDLYDEHLLTYASGNRYRMHDLIRQYLVETRNAERDAAFDRVTRHYLDRARHATLMIHPTENRRVLAPSGTAPWRTAAEAAAWAEGEYNNLVAAVHLAAGSGTPALVTELVTALYRPLANRGHSTDRIALNRLGVDIARRLGNRRAEAQHLEDLGALSAQVGKDGSVGYSRRALEIWEDLGDPVGQQACLADLGNAYRQCGEYTRAVDHLRRGLDLSVRTGDRRGEASLLNVLGLTCQRMGEWTAAIDHLERSASLYRELGNQLGEAIALANSGWAHQRARRPREAIGYHRRSMAVFRKLADRYNEAEQHWGIAEASHVLGESAAARSHWHQAISILRAIRALDDAEAEVLLDQEVPDTPELIRLNT